MIDITRPLHSRMAIYPSNPGVRFAPTDTGSSFVTTIELGSHTGTHIDAPRHVKPGSLGTASYSLGTMNGQCEVVDIANASAVIEKETLPHFTAKRVLLKTKNSAADINTFDPDFVALDESAAQSVVASGIKLIGIDGPSIKKKGRRDRVHQILLDAGLVILEGLWLRDVNPGLYTLFCLPLAVDLDGAPARAVLGPYPYC